MDMVVIQYFIKSVCLLLV